MRLEKRYIDVKKVVFDDKTFMENGVLHVCLLAEPADGVQNNEYFNAVSVASKKIAKYVAQCAKDCVPDEVQIFELKKDNLENLPSCLYLPDIFPCLYE